MKWIFKINKKGSDIPSVLFVIISIFIAGIILVVFSHLFSSIYGGVLDFLGSNPSVNYTQANETLTEIQNFERSMWDYAFLAIALGYVLMMVILAFTTQTNPVFYFIFIIMSLMGLFVGVALSNAWEKFADTETLSETIDRFPITDAILNNFFPIFIIVMIILTVIVLFGKRVLVSGQGGIG